MLEITPISHRSMSEMNSLRDMVKRIREFVGLISTHTPINITHIKGK